MSCPKCECKKCKVSKELSDGIFVCKECDKTLYTITEIRKSLEPLIKKNDLEFYLRQIENDKYQSKT